MKLALFSSILITNITTVPCPQFTSLVSHEQCLALSEFTALLCVRTDLLLSLFILALIQGDQWCMSLGGVAVTVSSVAGPAFLRTWVFAIFGKKIMKYKSAARKSSGGRATARFFFAERPRYTAVRHFCLFLDGDCCKTNSNDLSQY